MNAMTIDDDPEITAAREVLVRRVQQWALEDGAVDTPLEGLAVIRSDSTKHCMSTVYEPCLAFVVQGRKSVQLGDQMIDYCPLSYLASAVHLPVLGHIVEASPARPYLGIKLVIDPQEVSDLILEVGGKALDADDWPEVSCGLRVARMDGLLLNALDRLVRLLETPADAPVLAPLARREILYRALMGELGPHLRSFARLDSQAYRVSKAIAVLKDRFSESLRISELARQVNMSESSLYHSFKQVTYMSPLQFQKKLRLHEARRLMISEGLEAASASYRVGYESPSHFSREYSRMFGAPPKADVSRLRGEQQVPA